MNIYVASASDLFFCKWIFTASDHPLIWRIHGQTIVMLRGAVAALSSSDASELNLKHCKWHGAETGFEYRAVEYAERPIPVHWKVHVAMNEISGLLLFVMCSAPFGIFQEARPSVHQTEHPCYQADLPCDSMQWYESLKGEEQIIFVMYGQMFSSVSLRLPPLPFTETEH